MDTASEQLQWAKQLSHSQRQKPAQPFPSRERLVRIQKDLAALKKELQKALLQKDQFLAQSLTKTLIRLRAELLVCSKEQYEETEGSVPNAINQKLIHEYQQDCARLIAAYSASFA